MKIDAFFWKTTTAKIWLYGWGFKELAEHIKENKKEKEFLWLLPLLRKMTEFSKGEFNLNLSNQEKELIADNPFLWALASYLEEMGVFKV